MISYLKEDEIKKAEELPLKYFFPPARQHRADIQEIAFYAAK